MLVSECMHERAERIIQASQYIDLNDFFAIIRISCYHNQAYLKKIAHKYEYEYIFSCKDKVPFWLSFIPHP